MIVGVAEDNSATRECLDVYEAGVSTITRSRV